MKSSASAMKIRERESRFIGVIEDLKAEFHSQMQLIG